MVNAHFKCRHISQFKGLIDVINYWKWKDKEKAKLRKEMPIQFKLEHCSFIWSYLELWILDFSLVYMARKIRYRPKTFMRVQDSILPFGSPNLSIKREVWIYHVAQTLFSVQPISRVLKVQYDLILVLLESWDNFLELSWRLSV